MAVHELAGTKVRKEDYIDLNAIAAAYHSTHPDVTDPHQQVRFGTSGHRGQAGNGSFTQDHVAAITQAVCNFRKQFGAEGPLFVGEDTHYLSKLAYETVLSVLAANGVTAYVDSVGDFVPTPSVSRAILRYNSHREGRLADGLIITPSHNPPEHGGIKYNPITGGPAGSDITKAIEKEANRLLADHNQDVKIMAYDQAKDSAFVVPYDYKGLYVAELDSIIDLDAIRDAKLRILVNALGGSGMNYWHQISDVYHLSLDFVNDTYDPQFTFMNYDHDGKVRMDCSSAYVMSAVTGQAADYNLILANDPDYDRFGIVSGAEGMISANAFLTVAAHYLMTHRNFEGLGIAKTVVTTDMLARAAKLLDIPLYEVPVGFKYFGPLYTEGKIAFSGEESAGGSFIAKDRSVWTTDKDGMIMCLLAAEIRAVTGKSPIEYYNDLCENWAGPIPCAAMRQPRWKKKIRSAPLRKTTSQKRPCAAAPLRQFSLSPRTVVSPLAALRSRRTTVGSQPARPARKICTNYTPKASSRRTRQASSWKKDRSLSARP